MKTERRAFREEYVMMVRSRDNYTCYYCGSTEKLSLDHVVPLSRGGSNKLSNIITSCRSCNSKKHSTRLLPVFEKITLAEVESRNIKSGINGEEYITSPNKKRKKPEASREIARYKKRARMFCKKIDSQDGKQLYSMTFKGSKTQNRICAFCVRHGFDYLAVPFSDNGDKLLIVNGKVRGTDPISHEEAKEKLIEIAGFMSKNGSLRTGGNLGK